jgi:nucleotide-binding universal stress UspA family protein
VLSLWLLVSTAPRPATRRCGGLWRTPSTPAPSSMPSAAGCRWWPGAGKRRSSPSRCCQKPSKRGPGRELAQVVAAALARVADGVKGVAVGQRVVRGPAGAVLVGEANGADLLVVGHGPRVAEVLHRSVSWYCVRHVTCPVLIIPPAVAIRGTRAAATAGGIRMTTAPLRPVPAPSSRLTVRTVPSRRPWVIAGQGPPEGLFDGATPRLGGCRGGEGYPVSAAPAWTWRHLPVRPPFCAAQRMRGRGAAQRMRGRGWGRIRKEA